MEDMKDIRELLKFQYQVNEIIKTIREQVLNKPREYYIVKGGDYNSLIQNKLRRLNTIQKHVNKIFKKHGEMFGRKWDSGFLAPKEWHDKFYKELNGSHLYPMKEVYFNWKNLPNRSQLGYWVDYIENPGWHTNTTSHHCWEQPYPYPGDDLPGHRRAEGDVCYKQFMGWIDGTLKTLQLVKNDIDTLIDEETEKSKKRLSLMKVVKGKTQSKSTKYILDDDILEMISKSSLVTLDPVKRKRKKNKKKTKKPKKPKKTKRNKKLKKTKKTKKTSKRT